jgi:hypothetical protein
MSSADRFYRKIDGVQVEVSAEDYASHMASKRRRGLGDMVERAVKPFAKAIRHPCLQPDDTLRPGSPCAKIKAALNKLTA